MPEETTTSLQDAAFGSDEQQNQNGQQQNTDTTQQTNGEGAGNDGNATGRTDNAPVEIAVPTEWLKKEFDIEDAAVLKAEREELKTLREKKPEEITFANDQSKTVHQLLREGKTKEVREFLQQQEQLETLTSAEVTKDNADNIIKLGLKQKFPTLTDSEITFKFKKDYQLPKEPVQDATELDEDFDARVAEWKEIVTDKQTEKVIAAKQFIPDLLKAKSELTLPDIQKENPQSQQLTQKDLDAQKAQQENFLKSAEPLINAFDGFTVQVKDKDVDYPVKYSLSPDEKKLIGEKVAQFAASNFDANQVFAERWLNVDGKTLNTEQMIKDLSMLYGGEKAAQKIAVDAAGKRMEKYLEDKRQIDVNTQNQQGTFNPSNEVTKMDEVREAAFA